MGWIILGIVFLVVTIWSLKGTTFAKYHYKDRVDEHHIPMWILIIAFVVYCTPIVGIMAFIACHIWFFILASRKPHQEYEYLILELSKETVLHRISGAVVHYLTREI